MVYYICMDCGKLVQDDEPHFFYKKRHYHLACWYALIELPDENDNCPECEGPCQGHEGPPSTQAADKYMRENGIY
jgi:hypothetical protein